MDSLENFKQTLQETSPPQTSTPLLQALWYDAKGNWKKAHQIAQSEETKEAAWIHAYLHRKEGDISNARYWYTIAKQKFPKEESLSDEWQKIVLYFLSLEHE